MSLEVRTIDVSELVGWIACKDVGFLTHRTELEAYAEYLANEVDPARTWAGLDDDRVVGTLRSFPTPLTVPGPGEVIASALTNVTVAPTHRRRGLLTQMIIGDLTASAERGEALGILIASEYPIYGRFGYGMATESAAYKVDADAVRFREVTGEGGHDSGGSKPAAPSAGGERAGSVELVDAAAMRKEGPALYERFRASRPGAIGRDDHWWDRRLHLVEPPGTDPMKGYMALYRSASGEAEGYVFYQADSTWRGMRPTGTVKVDELLSVTRESYSRLWRYCCEIDLTNSVEASDRPTDEALPWLLYDGRAVTQTLRYDFLWVRILDVCACLSSRRYLLEGSLIFEVSDPLGFAAGRYKLDGGPRGATCSRTEEAPQLSLPVDVLGSIYLGGVSLKVVAAGGRMSEHGAGALDRADAMFRSPVNPWCSTWF